MTLALRRSGQTSLPAGPSGFLVSFFHYLRDPYGALGAIARRYGDPFLFPIPGTPGTVVCCDPEGVKAVFGSDPEHFVSFQTEATKKILGRNSLFFMSGPPHRAARKVLGAPFQSSRTRSWGPLVLEVARRRVAGVPLGRPVNMQATAQWITLEMIVRAIFGVADDARATAFHDAVSLGFDSVGPAVLFFGPLRHEFFGFGPWARVMEMVRRLNRLIDDEAAQRRCEGRTGDDVLSLLLSARYDDGTAMSDEDVRDKLYDLLIAGYETTAVASAWCVYEVLRHPAVHERLLDELLPLGDPPDPDALVRLPWLDAICSEGLRLHPNFTLLTRQVARPLRVKQYEVPPGMGVSVALAPVHHSAAVYEEPLVFRPERFLGRTYSPFEYMPFGGGAQRCLGATFGLLQMKSILSALFGTFEVELAKPGPIAPSVRAATVEPKGGVEIVLRRRRAG